MSSNRPKKSPLEFKATLAVNKRIAFNLIVGLIPLVAGLAQFITNTGQTGISIKYSLPVVFNGTIFIIIGGGFLSVSYTHLTLPTTSRV